jgi:hypothetical protein
MDVHTGTFPTRGQRTPDFENEFAVLAQASELEHFAGVPVLDPQRGC